MLEKLEKIFAQENLSSAQGQNESPGIGHFIEEVLNLGGGHLAMIVVVQIAMNASLIAAVGQVQLNVERNVQPLGLRRHLLQQTAHRDAPVPGLAGAIGSSEISRIS